MAFERLQKILAASGIASRRKSEELITAGRVTVNGQIVTELGTKADTTVDKISVDGKPLQREQDDLLVNLPLGSKRRGAWNFSHVFVSVALFSDRRFGSGGARYFDPDRR